MIVIGIDTVERYFAAHAGHRGVSAARSQYDAWLAIAVRSQWRSPEDVKASHPRASILKGSRVVFNIKGNDYRLVVAIDFEKQITWIRFVGTHKQYDKINAKTI